MEEYTRNITLDDGGREISIHSKSDVDITTLISKLFLRNGQTIIKPSKQNIYTQGALDSEKTKVYRFILNEESKNLDFDLIYKVTKDCEIKLEHVDRKTTDVEVDIVPVTLKFNFKGEKPERLKIHIVDNGTSIDFSQKYTHPLVLLLPRNIAEDASIEVEREDPAAKKAGNSNILAQDGINIDVPDESSANDSKRKSIIGYIVLFLFAAILILIVCYCITKETKTTDQKVVSEQYEEPRQNSDGGTDRIGTSDDHQVKDPQDTNDKQINQPIEENSIIVKEPLAIESAQYEYDAMIKLLDGIGTCTPELVAQIRKFEYAHPSVSKSDRVRAYENFFVGLPVWKDRSKFSKAQVGLLHTVYNEGWMKEHGMKRCNVYDFAKAQQMYNMIINE